MSDFKQIDDAMKTLNKAKGAVLALAFLQRFEGVEESDVFGLQVRSADASAVYPYLQAAFQQHLSSIIDRAKALAQADASAADAILVKAEAPAEEVPKEVEEPQGE